MRGFPILRIRAIPVEAHWSLLVGVFLLAAWLGGTRFLERHPELPSTAITAMTIACVLLFVASIVLHELGHALQARREGVEVDRIVLWFLGGIAFLKGLARSPGAELRVVAAGPLVSLVLAALFGALAWLGDELTWPPSVVGAATFIAQIELVILAFNLLPIFPLDGGRILHLALMRRLRPATAGRLTFQAGIAVAALVFAAGATGPFLGLVSAPFLSPESMVDGLSIMLWGLLGLWMALAVRPPTGPVGSPSRPLVVGDLLGPGPLVSSPDATLEEFLESVTGREGYGTSPFPVMRDGAVVGVISPGVAKSVPEQLRGGTAVAEVMVRKEEAVTLRPETPIEEAFEALRGGSGRGVVLDGGRVAGIVLASELADVLLRIREGTHAAVAPTAPRTPEVGW